MSPRGGVADAADLEIIGDDVDYPFWSRFSGFIHLVVMVSEGILPLVDEEVLEVTSLEEFGYL